MILFNNAFEFLDTHGLPLEIIMEHCDKRGIPVNLTQFKRDALKAGWKHGCTGRS